MRKLRPHQETALSLIAEEFRRGHRSVCVVMPCGAGKTILGAEAVARHLEKRPDGKALWIAHREELVGQGYDSLAAWGLQCGVIQASPCRPADPTAPVQVASIQTLIARDHRPQATFVFNDETHHACDNQFASVLEHYKAAGVPLIGATATPTRADGRGFEGLMDAIVCPVSMKELISAGFLVPFTLVDPGKVLEPNQIAQSPVEAYQAHAAGRKAILFARNVADAKQFTADFEAAGIRAETVWGEMPNRREVLAAYKAGDIRVLSSVGVLTEGFDDPATSCVILARSVGSLSLYLQMLGRGLRASPGKTDAVLIDLRGNCHIPGFGPPDADRQWTLKGDGTNRGKVLPQPKERFCAVCKVLLGPEDLVACVSCGIAKPELVALKIANMPLTKYAAKLAEPEYVRRAYFEKLVALARSKGWSKWQPHAKFRALYGVAPPKSWWSRH